MDDQLRTFQKQFIRGALAPGVDVAALSIPRGNGKSWLAAHLLQRALTPGDDLHLPGAEYLLCSGSIEQSRLCFRFIRAELEPSGEYRFMDSSNRGRAISRRMIVHPHPWRTKPDGDLRLRTGSVGVALQVRRRPFYAMAGQRLRSRWRHWPDV